MVSDDTRDRTQEMLEQGNWFGMDESQVTLMKQEKVAAIQVGQRASVIVSLVRVGRVFLSCINRERRAFFVGIKS